MATAQRYSTCLRAYFTSLQQNLREPVVPRPQSLSRCLSTVSRVFYLYSIHFSYFVRAWQLKRPQFSRQSSLFPFHYCDCITHTNANSQPRPSVRWLATLLLLP